MRAVQSFSPSFAVFDGSAGFGRLPSAFAADDGIWSVSKSSGEVWITTTGASRPR